MSKQYLENTILYLLSFLPLALIVGSAVSTTFIILISIIFLISSLITKDWSWLKDKYIKLLFIFYFYLTVALKSNFVYFYFLGSLT